jgi:hypothetical protein
MFLLYYILSFVFYWGLYCKKIIKFCYYDFVLFLLVIIKNQYYDIFILFHHQVNVFYTKNLKDVSMKWGVINLNTPFNNWSCINTSVHTFRVKFMVLNATFNNISVILWWSVLLVEESGVPGESHQPAQVTDKLHQLMLYRTHHAWVGFKFTMLVMIGTDCILLGLYCLTPPSIILQ